MKLFGKVKEKMVECYCVPKALEKTQFRESPSGRYMLVVESFKTGEGTWNYTKGTVYNQDDGSKIAEVCRNYSSFWECWAEEHADGHDYMLCGKNYQGQTIIQLDTGEVKDFLPKEACQGWGFCWADVNVSPDKSKLVVDGCYWAAPYEIRIYDFTSPMEMPYKLCEGLDEVIYSSYRWLNDDEILLTSDQEGRKSDGKLESELTEDEFADIEADEEDLGFFEVLSVWNHKTSELVEVGRKESDENNWTWVEDAVAKFEKERIRELM